MKTEIITQEQARRVPEVKDVFHCDTSEKVYVRVTDSIGRQVFGGEQEQDDKGVIYAYRFEDGQICKLYTHVRAFTILQPVGGVAKFERV